MRIAYVRVSTVEQNEARQVEALEPHGIEKWFIEKVSGATLARPKLQEMVEFAREGDTIYIHDYTRMGRNMVDLLTLIESLQAKGEAVISLKEGFDTSTPTGKLILSVLASIAEFERANLLERQREGIAIARRNGVYTGRKATVIPDFERHVERLRNREVTKAELCRELGIARPTLDRHLKNKADD